MKDETLLRLEEARERILATALPLRSEVVPLSEALGRVLAVDAVSLLRLPPWDNSAMDGFAVRSADVVGASPSSPVTLEVVGEVAAGHVPAVDVAPGTAVRILTGALLPPGADTVVPVEDTDAAGGVTTLPRRVAVRVAVGPGAHVRLAGSDVEGGAPLLPAGTRIGPAAIAALAASGHANVYVHRRPRVAIVATGDELRPVGEALDGAAIPDSNSESLVAQVLAAGGEPLRLGIASDDHEAVRDLVAEGILAADVLIATGGVSVGSRDVVKDVFAEVGELDLWRVAIQPGKPLAFGSAPRPDGGECLLFGLPGNPVSSYVTFELFVRPLLRRLCGAPATQGRVTVRAVLDERVSKSSGRRAFLRVRLLEPDADGRPHAVLAGGQGSHVLSALALADGLAVIPEEVDGLPAGAEVEVIRLDIEIA